MEHTVVPVVCKVYPKQVDDGAGAGQEHDQSSVTSKHLGTSGQGNFNLWLIGYVTFIGFQSDVMFMWCFITDLIRPAVVGYISWRWKFILTRVCEDRETNLPSRSHIRIHHDQPEEAAQSSGTSHGFTPLCCDFCKMRHRLARIFWAPWESSLHTQQVGPNFFHRYTFFWVWDKAEKCKLQNRCVQAEFSTTG